MKDNIKLLHYANEYFKLLNYDTYIAKNNLILNLGDIEIILPTEEVNYRAKLFLVNEINSINSITI